MKEIVMNVDDEIYEFLKMKGKKSVDKNGEETYSLPVSFVYQEMRKYSIPADLVDEVIEHYSYYGYKTYSANMGGKQVEFITVTGDGDQ